MKGKIIHGEIKNPFKFLVFNGIRPTVNNMTSSSTELAGSLIIVFVSAISDKLSVQVHACWY